VGYKIKNYFILGIIFYIPWAFAIDCKLANLLSHHSIASNADFWEKFSQINPNNKAALEELIKKYNPDLLKNSDPVVVKKSLKQKFELSTKAEKARLKLNKQNQEKFDEMIELVNTKGPEAFYEQPGKWRPERLKRNREEHTIRLHGDYRVLFEVSDDGVVNILDVGNTGRSVGH